MPGSWSPRAGGPTSQPKREGNTRQPFVAAALCGALLAGCARRPRHALAGDYDVYIALSAKPKFGFEGWRRMAFAHFTGSDSGHVRFIERRIGQPMLSVHQVALHGDSATLTQDSQVAMRAAWRGDTLAGLQYAGCVRVSRSP